MKPFARGIGLIAGVVAVIVLVAAIFIWSGAYNVAADDPHTRLFSSLLETARDRSIEARSASIALPKLDEPEMVARGAGLYSEMCVSCHLAPGIDESELRAGLYPQPPKLVEYGASDPKEAFWIVKHGIKMTAMPAWGVSHDDAALWDLVSFLRAMPKMSSAQYEQLARAGDHDEEAPGHMHGDMHGATAAHQH